MSFVFLLESIGKLLISLEPVISSSVIVLKESYEYNHTKAALYDLQVAKEVKAKSKETAEILNDSQNDIGYYYPTMTDNCIQTSTIESIAPIVETRDYSETILSEDEEAFFNSLVEAPPEQEANDENEYLDFNEFTMTHSIPTNLTVNYAPAKEAIADYVIGLQKWIVEVIGYEQDYIHVSDGTSRTWLQVNNQQVEMGDILQIEVDRKSHDIVSVNAIELLQRRSLDYVLTENLDLENEYQEAM